jgi:hypothetical protein
MARTRKSQQRFGIGEWYGKSFVTLTPEERKRFAEIQQGEEATTPSCPFLSTEEHSRPCWKTGGVCSLRSYEQIGNVVQINSSGSTLRATCPSRFEEGGTIYRWIGEVILDNAAAIAVGQVPFLERVPTMGGEECGGTREGEGVGRIDNVLIVPDTQPLQWCPVEIQAVYFSGDKMAGDFRAIHQHQGISIPFPAGRRRPDYRSCGPKRLMPQLQIKVPTLRRWGKKMAVVVDEDFIRNMGQMRTVADVSNADVAWFVVNFEESDGVVRLARGAIYFTELEAAVSGLIAGKPVTRQIFEERIVTRLRHMDTGPGEVATNE